MLVSLVLVMLIAASCSSPSVDYDLPPITMESSHVKLGMQHEAEICQRYLERMDAYIERIRGVWNLSRVGDEKFSLYVLDASRTEEICGTKLDEDVAGCFVHRQDLVFVVVEENQMFSVYHELTHAILEMDAEIPFVPFFGEGMAEAFGDGGCKQIDNASKPSLEDAYDGVDTTDGRTAIQDFFKYLYEQHGAKALLDWGRRLRAPSSLDELSTTFEEVFGRSLADAWQTEWPLFTVPSFTGCLAETTPWQGDGETWEHSFDSCSSSVSYTNEGLWKEEAVIEIKEADMYRFEYSSAGQGVYLRSCEVCGGEDGGGDYSVPILGPGRYAIQMYADPEMERPVDVLVEPYVQCDPLGGDCGEWEKCNDFVFKGGIRCAPLGDPPVEVGERCEQPDIGENDPCVEGASCIAGLCRPLCEGTADAPICPEGYACFKKVLSNPFPGVCMKNCSRPLPNECEEDEYCKEVDYNDTVQSICAVYEGDSLAVGETCDFVQVEVRSPFYVSEYSKCVSGALCVNGACEPICDPADDSAPCPQETECVSLATELEQDDEPYGLCITPCDAMAPSCPDDSSCVQLYAESPKYFCSARSPSDDFADYGEDICLVFGCGEGLYCTSSEDAVPSAEVTIGIGVCTALCDPAAENPNEQCPDADLGQTCRETTEDPTLGFCAME